MKNILRSIEITHSRFFQYQLVMAQIGIMTLKKLGSPLGFSDILKLQVGQTPREMFTKLAENGELLLAYCGVTVITTVCWKGRRLAVFTKNAYGELAHICGYVPADCLYAEVALSRLAEVMIIKQGEFYLYNNAYSAPPLKSVPFKGVKYQEENWTVDRTGFDNQFHWAPSARSGVTLIGPDILKLDKNKASKVMLYLDPWTNSAIAYTTSI